MDSGADGAASFQLVSPSSAGMGFGDLKPENLIVTGPPAAIRCIDVGERQNKAARLKSIRSFTTGAIGGMEQEKQNHPMTCLLSQ